MSAFPCLSLRQLRQAWAIWSSRSVGLIDYVITLGAFSVRRFPTFPKQYNPSGVPSRRSDVAGTYHPGE
jgi:hypothetical protein